MQIHDNLGNIIDDLNPFPIKEVDSTIVKPVKIDSHTSLTIQTHNAVSVALSGQSQSSWLDCDGFGELALTFKNDAATSSSLEVYWSNDGTTIHGYEIVVASSTAQFKQASIPTKARYAKVILNNGDGAAAHTMSAWAYLKA